VFDGERNYVHAFGEAGNFRPTDLLLLDDRIYVASVEGHSIYVYDRLETRYVARLRSNKVDADIWAQLLHDLGHYYDNARVGVEKNGAGITTIQSLRNIFHNLFYRQRPGKMQGTYVQEYGWLQTNEAKQILADELKRHFRELFSQVPCAVLLDECSTFIRHENGKLEHEDGKLDDCVMAAGIALQVSMLMPPVQQVEDLRSLSAEDKRLAALEEGIQDDFERYMTREIGLDADPWAEQDPLGSAGRVYHDLT